MKKLLLPLVLNFICDHVKVKWMKWDFCANRSIKQLFFRSDDQQKTEMTLLGIY